MMSWNIFMMNSAATLKLQKWEERKDTTFPLPLDVGTLLNQMQYIFGRLYRLEICFREALR